MGSIQMRASCYMELFAIVSRMEQEFCVKHIQSKRSWSFMPYAPSLSGPLTWEPTPQELSDKYVLSMTTSLCWTLHRVWGWCVSLHFSSLPWIPQTLTTMYNLFTYYLYGLIDTQQAPVSLYPITRLGRCWEMHRLPCNLPLQFKM